MAFLNGKATMSLGVPYAPEAKSSSPRNSLNALAIMASSGGSSSVVERQLPKLNVAGSIPVSRSIHLPPDASYG